MKDVKLKKVLEKGATFNILNEADQVIGTLFCMFLPNKYSWFSTISENKLENLSELKSKAVLELRKANQNVQHLSEIALPL